ncbi:MAG: hypothetical protein LQ352_006012 [Teloschistes flavicans]|nr:MAG: hypothetical protein LQ352_006012 [Teloschistes flavicans]
MAEVSSTRLYLGNLPREVTKEDIQNHFKDAPGTLAEVKLMNGFGFIEYEDAMDARDLIVSDPATVFAHGSYLLTKGKDGSDLNGSRLTSVRTLAHVVQPIACKFLDLKDFARRSGLDVVYSEVGRDRDGKGFVEFETASDLKTAVEKLDNNDFKGATVRCLADVSTISLFTLPELHIDQHLSPRTRFPAMTAMADPAPRHLDVAHTLRMDTTTVARLHLATILLAALAMNIAAVVLHLATTTIMPATIAGTVLRLQCVPVAAHPSMIPTHLPEAVTTVTRTLLRLHDVPMMIRMLPMGMDGQGIEARRQGDMDMMSGVTGDCSSPPFSSLVEYKVMAFRGRSCERGLLFQNSSTLIYRIASIPEKGYISVKGK